MAVCPDLPATWSSEPSLCPSASSDICGFDLNQVCLLQGRSVYFLSAPMVRSKTSQEQKDRLVIAVGNWKEKSHPPTLLRTRPCPWIFCCSLCCAHDVKQVLYVWPYGAPHVPAKTWP